MMHAWFLLGLLSVVPQERIPAEPMSYQGAHWLERDSRDDEERPDIVLGVMDLEPGDVVADVGAGSGYYARRMAREVAPSGKVLAVDIQPEMLSILEDLAREEGVSGIESVLAEPDDPNLPEAAVDWILLADVYHEMAEPDAVLGHLRNALAPGGRVALLEYRVEDGSGDHIKADHAMSVRQVLSEWRPAGFELVDLVEELPSQHLFVFRREGDAGNAGDVLEEVDLFDARERELLDVQASGRDGSSVTLTVTRRVERDLVVTLETGTRFASDRTSDMVARRDGAWVLRDNGPQEWVLRALRREREGAVPSDSDSLTPQPASTNPVLYSLAGVFQRGTYHLRSGGVYYLARVQAIEQAAVWIATGDPRYEDLRGELDVPRLGTEDAAALALFSAHLAGVDVSKKAIWSDTRAIFSSVSDRVLLGWYRRLSRSLRGRHVSP